MASQRERGLLEKEQRTEGLAGRGSGDAVTRNAAERKEVIEKEGTTDDGRMSEQANE